MSQTKPDIFECEEMADALEASGDYKILRRLSLDSVPLSHPIAADGGPPAKKIVFLDTETTGLDPDSAEVIEFAAIKMSATDNGEILAIDGVCNQLCQPASPIPDEITKLTGISNELVQGRSFDVREIEDFVSDADLILAHNSAFDRDFAEAISPVFSAIPWGCTQSQIPWRAKGYDSSRLSSLVIQFGYFFDAHRAMADCVAGVFLLTRTPNGATNTVLKTIIAKSAEQQARIWAIGSPFEKRSLLKSRNYQWSDGTSGHLKSWWTEVPDEMLESELQFLAENVLGPNNRPPIKMITSLDRFSRRG